MENCAVAMESWAEVMESWAEVMESWAEAIESWAEAMERSMRAHTSSTGTGLLMALFYTGLLVTNREREKVTAGRRQPFFYEVDFFPRRCHVVSRDSSTGRRPYFGDCVGLGTERSTLLCFNRLIHVGTTEVKIHVKKSNGAKFRFLKAHLGERVEGVQYFALAAFLNANGVGAMASPKAVRIAVTLFKTCRRQCWLQYLRCEMPSWPWLHVLPKDLPGQTSKYFLSTIFDSIITQVVHIS
ncbi:hypothetical protein DPEC_G00315860 [Dallia pectoralis]|uniref:Uncharacterized protein n=1 Tax=Dallia pectoralis TaxID=75939 RepID=A0ACC2FCL3_DALPE|nr:hypothetical protein DPEC_G00315860 [Dallia pectoralis]